MNKNAQNLFRVLCILFVAVFSLTGLSAYSADATETVPNQYVSELLDLKHTLRFNEDGKFKIVIFADIQESYPLRADTKKYINKILDLEKPDLVLLGGDNHSGGITNKSQFRTYMNSISEPMESRKIPWAQVYGNHVEGGYNSNLHDRIGMPSKAEQQEIFESYSYNVSKAGTVSGVGNYVLPILRSDSDKIAFNVFGLDSHSYANESVGGQAFEDKVYLKRLIYGGAFYPSARYETIHFDQIRWYWNASVALEKYNGSKIPAMMLFHIALQEWEYVARNPDQTDMEGVNPLGVFCPELASGLFHACYERGDVKGMFAGHMHHNDFVGTYMGIKLGFVPTIGGLATYDPKTRGARVVEIQQDDGFNFTTRMVYCKDLD